jgi:hypothetical protein
MSSSPAVRRSAAFGLIAAAAALIAGCGGGGGSEPSTLSVSIDQNAKTFNASKEAESGLVTVTLKNNASGAGTHGLQFIQYTGDHTIADVKKQLAASSNAIPDWIKLPGGINGVAPGDTGRATLNLPEGDYLMVDAAALGGPTSGPPAMSPITLSGGETGDLPDTPAQVTADSVGDDEFKWDISGLKAGKNDLTFDSKGEDTVHIIIAAPIKGKAPSLDRIKKDLASNGPPPPYVDTSGIQSTALLDSGASQTLTLDLKKPGQYIFFCPLTDRDGKGKPHDQEGLLSVETVK